MITIDDILEDMYNAAKGICDKLYPSERPAATSDSLKSFIVYKVVGDLFNEEISDDGSYDHYTTVAEFMIFVRDKVSSANINMMDISTMRKKVKAVKSLFPIVGKYCTMSEPGESLSISDGKQFHCRTIQCKVETR